MTAAAFVNAARGFVRRKARWRHQGRKPWAVDCLGKIRLSLLEAGYQPRTEWPTSYGRTPWDNQLRNGLLAEFGEPVSDWHLGDIPLIRWDKGEPSHVAVLGDYLFGGLSIIHCLPRHPTNPHPDRPGCCVETILAGHVRNCVIEVYRPKWSEG